MEETKHCHCGEVMYRWSKRTAWICIYHGPYHPLSFVGLDIGAIMRGLADVDAGRTIPLEQVRRELKQRREQPR